MTTQFPTEIDDFYNPDPNAPLSSGHAAQHADANAAIEALQRKVSKELVITNFEPGVGSLF